MESNPFEATSTDDTNPFAVPDDEPKATGEEVAQHFVRIWAEAVIRAADRARAIRVKDAKDFRNAERNEEWSPTDDDLYATTRVQWAEDHTLVWSAHQLEVWRARLAKERGQEPQPDNEALSRLRNVLEHLVDPDLEDWVATIPEGADRKRRWSLRSMPGEQFDLGMQSGGSLFGLLESEDLHALAMEVVKSVQAELDERERDMVDAYLAD
ncbi:hypothetical protein ABT144_14580 [Streptomyces sp. NPDC002039]|uniref:hypothetical protein n=1 Tax=Streptomyces sp. NPDC002039 TaxID=3154660 RepID=UPI00332192E9